MPNPVIGTQRGVNPEGDAVIQPVNGIGFMAETPLGANESFVSDIFPVMAGGYTTLLRFLSADVASAPSGVKLEYFNKKKEIIPSLTLASTYNPNAPSAPRAFVGRASYARYTFTNGPVAQTAFNFSLYLLTGPVQTAAQNLNETLPGGTFALITKAALQGHNTTSGNYEPVEIQDGALKVNVANQPSGPQSVTGTVTANINGTVPVSGSVSISNLPATQPISGNVGVTGAVEVSNDSGNPLPVSGSVSVSNLPATQPVSGSVMVSNFPATQPVSGTVNANVTFPATQPISGSVSVSNLPVTQPVSAAALPLPSGAATSALQGTANAALGTPTDAAVTDPTATASMIALLKGLLTESISAGTTGTPQDITLVANVAQTIAANANRKGVIVSSTNGTILIGLGYTATATRWTYRIVTNTILEVPEHWAGLAISLLSTTASTATVTLVQ